MSPSLPTASPAPPSVQVATLSASGTIPSVTSSNTTVPDSSLTLTIVGTHFDTTNPSKNSVVFTSLGVTGAVTAVNAAGTQLTVTLYTSPTSLGALYASVTTDGISSGSPVQVATIGNGTWVVTSSGSGGLSNITLPYAVAHAQNGDTITFANELTGGNTISLISTLTLNNSVAITDAAANVTVTGNDAVQDFSVSAGATVTITGLTIEKGFGSVAANGGGINNAGTLTLVNATVSNNGGYGHVSYSGGGIHNSGTLTIYDSTVNNNTAAFSNGGGIYNASSGTLSISNSTIYGNTFGSHGGGIYNAGSLTLSNSTVTGNTTFVYYGSTYGSSGGGIFNTGRVTMSNTIVSGNTGGFLYAPYVHHTTPSDIEGSVTAYNSLIGNTSGAHHHQQQQHDQYPQHKRGSGDVARQQRRAHPDRGPAARQPGHRGRRRTDDCDHRRHHNQHRYHQPPGRRWRRHCQHLGPVLHHHRRRGNGRHPCRRQHSDRRERHSRVRHSLPDRWRLPGHRPARRRSAESAQHRCLYL